MMTSSLEMNPGMWLSNWSALDNLSDNDTAAIDKFIYPRLQYIRQSYRDSGDLLMAISIAKALSKQITQLSGAAKSLQFATLLRFISDLLITQAGSREGLREASLLLEQAINILHSTDGPDWQRIDAYSACGLCLAVTQKALDKPDDALEITRGMTRFLKRQFDASYLQTIPLLRQEVLITQDHKQFAQLLDGVDAYLDKDKVEAYATVKRVFEFCMNNKMVSKAKDLRPIFEMLFRERSEKLSLVARVSFSKNIGQYYAITGDKAKSKIILEKCMVFSKGFGLGGQLRQVEALLADLGDGGTTCSLPTFRL